MEKKKIGARITSMVYSGKYMDDLVPETDYWTISKERALEYKKKAEAHEPVNWDYVPENYNHIVFYSEEKDKEGCIKHIDVFVDGAGGCFDDDSYVKNFMGPNRYTIAEHKRPLKKYKIKAIREFEGEIISSNEQDAIMRALARLEYYDKEDKETKETVNIELLEE